MEFNESVNFSGLNLPRLRMCLRFLEQLKNYDFCVYLPEDFGFGALLFPV